MGIGSPNSVCMDTTCRGLLRELEQIWNDIGESEAKKEQMLMEIERECLEVYRRKVDEAANAKAGLHQNVVAMEAELATLMAALGESNSHHLRIQTEKRSASLKEILAIVTPSVEDLRMKRDERVKQFADIKAHIEKISGEISGYSTINSAFMNSLTIEEQDLSLRKLTECQTHLSSLQKEKSDRVNKVIECVNEVHLLCAVCGLDFGKTISEVHPSLHGTNLEQSTNISNTTLEGLELTILKLKTERKTRIQKMKEIAVTLFELWNLMDSPREERRSFMKITWVVGLSQVEEVKEPGALSTEIIEQASAEVSRLTKLKASRMKQLVMKKRLELEEICRLTHIEPDTNTVAEKANALIDSGLVEPSELLANIEAQIAKAKDEAVSRKEIMERIDRWLSACEEESWLQDYSQDENRYSSGRGAHINLKRAERARVAVGKIPAMVDNLITKTRQWENEKKTMFLYDGVRLVSILGDYKLTRQQKEEDKKRSRDQKKLQDLLLTEKELMYGSKPSPKRSNSFRASMTPTPRRRSSFGSGAPELLTPLSYPGRQNGNGYYRDPPRRLSTAPLNFVSIPKEDTMSSYASVYGSDSGSPSG